MVMQHRWGKLTGVVFIDLCKAFDTVNHQVLLHKLFSFGICQNTGSFKWFWLYLCGRSHCVKWNGVFFWQKRCYYWSAPWVHIGSVVFILFVNNNPKCLYSIQMFLYIQTIHHRMFHIKSIHIIEQSCMMI